MPDYLTRAEVHGAADLVDAGGKKPSTASVHAILGRGSNSTIQQHILTWKARPQIESLSPIPAALTAEVSLMAADLWHVAVTAAAEQSANAVVLARNGMIEAQSHAASVAETLDKSTAENSALAQRIAELEQMAAEREAFVLELQNYANNHHIEKVKLEAEIEALRRLTDSFGSALEFFKDVKKSKIAKSNNPSLI